MVTTYVHSVLETNKHRFYVWVGVTFSQNFKLWPCLFPLEDQQFSDSFVWVAPFANNTAASNRDRKYQSWRSMQSWEKQWRRSSWWTPTPTISSLSIPASLSWDASLKQKAKHYPTHHTRSLSRWEKPISSLLWLILPIILVKPSHLDGLNLFESDTNRRIAEKREGHSRTVRMWEITAWSWIASQILGIGFNCCKVFWGF